MPYFLMNQDLCCLFNRCSLHSAPNPHFQLYLPQIPHCKAFTPTKPIYFQAPIYKTSVATSNFLLRPVFSPKPPLPLPLPVLHDVFQTGQYPLSKQRLRCTCVRRSQAVGKSEPAPVFLCFIFLNSTRKDTHCTMD